MKRFFCILVLFLLAFESSSFCMAEDQLDKEFLLRSFLVNAELAREHGNCKEAISFYKKYLAQIEKSPGVWNNLGVCLYEEKRYSDALLAFKMAYLQEKKPVYLYNQAITLIKMGKAKQACSLWEKVKSFGDIRLSQFDSLNKYCSALGNQK